jgi:glucose/arabinose dehydrogenase
MNTPSPIPSESPLVTLTPTLLASGSPSITVNHLPGGGEYRWLEVVSGLEKPVGLASPADDSGRLFILEQAGVIRIFYQGVLLPQPFLDIRNRVGSRAPEQGLLGLAFHPRYKENGYFYINYTDQNGDTVIARYTVSTADPNRADASSEKRLLFIPQPYPNHNGGSVVFGPEGYLYLGLGDGGSGGDPQGNAQSTQTLLGKILRLDVDQGDPYAIPKDNPFVQGGGLAEIWAYGLRNPWRFSFDRLSGDLYIGDVGQNEWEEIDFLPAGSPAGANFGWNYREGKHRFEGLPTGLDLIDPVVEYDHSQGCSVTGGVVYRGPSLPDWQGVYLYGDYCSGTIWGLLRNPDGLWQNAPLFESGFRISSFGEDQAGEVYVLDHATGSVYRLGQ